MPRTPTFSGLTVEILTRMKEFGRAEYGIVYDRSEGPVASPPARRRWGVRDRIRGRHRKGTN